MKIKINKDNKEEIIDLANPKGREVKKGMKLLFETKGAEEGEQLGKLEIYADYLEEMTARNSNMTVEDLDDLESDEKDKLITFYSDKVLARFDFLKSSLQRQN